MTNNEKTLLQAIGDGGIITDGDWIESRDQDPSGNIRLIQLADVGDGQFLNKSRKYVNAQTVERLRCTLLVPGDVLVARLPDPLGRACVFPNILQPAIAAVDVCIIRPNPNELHPDWLASFLNSPPTRALIALEAQGATRSRVPTGKLKQLKLQPPPIDSQKHFVERWTKTSESMNRAAASVRLQKTEMDILGELAPEGRCAIVLDDGFLFRKDEDAFVETKRKLVDECDLWAIISLPGGCFSGAGAAVKTNLLFFTKGKKTSKIWYYDLTHVKVGKKSPMTLAHFGFGKNGEVLDDADLPAVLNRLITKPFELFFEMQHTALEIGDHRIVG